MARRRLGRPVWFALALSLFPSVLSAQSVSQLRMDPQVIPANYSGTVRVEVTVIGQPTRVAIAFSPGNNGNTSIAAVDNGTNGDRQAGDHIYTAELPGAAIVAALQPDDVHREFIGYVDLFAGTQVVFQGNLFADVYTGDIPPRPITRLSQFVQATDHVVNIVEPAYYVNFDDAIVTRDFYQALGDDYDFIAIITVPMRFLNRDHFLVRNAGAGTGQGTINLLSEYGSAARLLGISEFPIATAFDAAETGFIHELGHQWINFLNFAPLAQGIPHWPLSTMATGVMGFSLPPTNEGVMFACDIETSGGVITLLPRPNGPTYNDFDLYLMGLLPPDQVRPQFVFPDQSPADLGACNGQVYTGATIPVTVDDIVAHYGPRTPPAGQSPTHFRVATILVTPDDLASPETMWEYSWLAERGELQAPTATHDGFEKETDPPFYVATGARATLDLSIALPAPGFTILPTPASVSVVSGASASYVVGAMPTGASFADAVTLACSDLPAHATCAFAPASVTPGSAGATSVLTIATTDAPVAAAVGGMSAGLIGLGFVPVAVAAARIARRRAPRQARIGCAAVFVITAAAAAAACGPPTPATQNSSGNQNPSAPATTMTAPGTYVVTVIGTAGAIEQSATVSLTVQ